MSPREELMIVAVVVALVAYHLGQRKGASAVTPSASDESWLGTWINA